MYCELKMLTIRWTPSRGYITGEHKIVLLILSHSDIPSKKETSS